MDSLNGQTYVGIDKIGKLLVHQKLALSIQLFHRRVARSRIYIFGIRKADNPVWILDGMIEILFAMSVFNVRPLSSSFGQHGFVR